MNRERFHQFPFEFGEFSLHAIGVTLNYPRELDRLSIPVAILLLAGRDPMEQRLAQFQELLTKETDNTAKGILTAYATAPTHEIRHFHDYLASPHGAMIVSETVVAAANIPSAVKGLLSERAIGLPISAWRDLTDKLHAIYQRESRNRCFSRLPPASASAATAAAEQALAKTRRWLDQEDLGSADLSTNEIIEASAIDVQATHVQRMFGQEALEAFFNYIQQTDAGTLYTKPFDYWNEISTQFEWTECLSITVRNALYFFALCGATSLHDPRPWAAHPAARLSAIVGQMFDDRYVPREESILDYFAEWSSKMGLRNFEDSLWGSVENTRQVLQQLESQPVVAELVSAFREWTDAHEYMVSRVVKDPISYFDPAKYLDRFHEWVAAPVYVFTTSPHILTERALKNWESIGWQHVIREEQRENTAERRASRLQACLLYGPQLTQGKPVLTRKAARNLSEATWLAHTLWLKGSLSMTQREVGRQMLLQAMKYPDIEVFLL